MEEPAPGEGLEDLEIVALREDAGAGGSLGESRDRDGLAEATRPAVHVQLDVGPDDVVVQLLRVGAHGREGLVAVVVGVADGAGERVLYASITASSRVRRAKRPPSGAALVAAPEAPRSSTQMSPLSS